MHLSQPLLVAATAALLALTTTTDARTRAECERDYKPQVGQAGKDVIWVPTPDELVNRTASPTRSGSSRATSSRKTSARPPSSPCTCCRN